MIDPKLNEIPAKPAQTSSPAQGKPAENAARPASGLSIQDTIAGDSNLSVGGRGVDTSGAKVGAGAGGGSTYVSPISNSSPAPAIAPGAKLNAAGQSGVERADTGLPGTGRTETASSDSGRGEATWQEISARAYEIWCESGFPEGTHDSDWRRAEEELGTSRRLKTRSAGGSI